MTTGKYLGKLLPFETNVASQRAIMILAPNRGHIDMPIGTSLEFTSTKDEGRIHRVGSARVSDYFPVCALGLVFEQNLTTLVPTVTAHDHVWEWEQPCTKCTCKKCVRS